MKRKFCDCKCPTKKSSRPSPQKRQEQERKKLAKELQNIGKQTSLSQSKDISFWSKRKDRESDEKKRYEKLLKEANHPKSRDELRSYWSGENSEPDELA